MRLMRLMRWGILAGGIFLAFLFFASAGHLLPGKTPESLGSIRGCISTNEQGFDQSDFDCLTRVVGGLLAIKTPGEILGYLVASSTPSVVTINCHDVAHVVGEELAKKYPLDTALSLCTESCRAGCVHGAVGEGVLIQLGTTSASEDIEHQNLPQIEEIGKAFCERSGAICHGIGHLVFMATQNYKDALSACDKTYSESPPACYTGVFMESVGSNASLSYMASSTPNPDSDYGFPCSTIAPKAESACYFYQLQFQKILFEKERVPVASRMGISRGVCEKLSGDRRSNCFFGIGYYADRAEQYFGTEPGRTCDDLSGVDESSCVGGALSRFGENNDPAGAASYCRSVVARHPDNAICASVLGK